MAFNSQTTAQQWMSFLENLKETSDTFEHQPIICPKLIMFGTPRSKGLWIEAAKNKAAIRVDNGALTQEEADATIEGWTQGTTVGGFLPLIRSGGTLAIFRNALGNAIEQQSQETVSCHTYAVFYQKGVLGVYDPNFVAETERLDYCKGVPLIKKMVNTFKRKGTNRRLSEVWFGGGGDDGSGMGCEEMTRAWVEREIVTRRGADLGNWAEREGWVELRF